MNKKLLKLIQDFTEMKEGFTFRLVNRGIKVPVTGYVVSVTPLIDIDIEPESIIAYIKKNKKITINKEKYQLYVGGWYDEENDKYVLDLSVITEDLEKAREIGRLTNQKMIYDLDEEIDILVDEQ